MVLTDGVLAQKASVSLTKRVFYTQITRVDSWLDSCAWAIFQGQNNSGVSPEAACEAANAIGAVVDAPWQGQT